VDYKVNNETKHANRQTNKQTVRHTDTSLSYQSERTRNYGAACCKRTNNQGASLNGVHYNIPSTSRPLTFSIH